MASLEGYNTFKDVLDIEKERDEEFPHISGAIYLDHIGATVYAKRLLTASMLQQTSTLFGNPHSQNPSSVRSSDAVEEMRDAVLRFFGTTSREYSVVFTSGATAALKMVAESFPWSPTSQFRHLNINHTSVLGMRELASARGSAIRCEDFKGACDWLEGSKNEESDLDGPSLFAMPGSCNFSGTYYPLEWVKKCQNRPGPRRWYVLLDAASRAATGPVNLSEYPADFMAVSFYKIFGYPTGVGALLIRNESAGVLSRTYFGGGTVSGAAATERFHVLRENISERFEDGTLNFLGIAALRPGLELMEGLQMTRVRGHTQCVASLIREGLRSMQHFNGAPVCQIYEGEGEGLTPGAAVTFNVLDARGQFVGYSEVERLAALEDIHLRTGCFCNVGACQEYLNLTADDIKANLAAGHVCWDSTDIIDGKPTGGVRVSVGYMTTTGDVEGFLAFLRAYFLETVSVAMPKPSTDVIATHGLATVHSLYVYPIKSCAGMKVDSWEIGGSGLLFDREWVVVDQYGKFLNQKRAPILARVVPTISLARRTLTVALKEEDGEGWSGSHITIRLDGDDEVARSIRVCGKCRDALPDQGEVSQWFSTVVGRPCTLMRKSQCSPSEDGTASASFANDSQFLVVSTASAEAVNERILATSGDNAVPIHQYRPNIVLTHAADGAAPYLQPFEEDHWTALTICGEALEVLCPCTRCSMVCVEQLTGKRAAEPLKTLSRFRKAGAVGLSNVSRSEDEPPPGVPIVRPSGILFGVHTKHRPHLEKSNTPPVVHVGGLVAISRQDGA